MPSATVDALHTIPGDDDGPFEVRAWITKVLLQYPPLCASDEEAEKLAGKFHGSGLDLKNAAIGDLQADSSLGPAAGLRVFQRIEDASSAFESIMSSLKSATKSWG
ncbi:hypothetical protein LTS18_001918, partial [Coniosporium uncinatum]